jgi:hypothetical protein
VLRAVFKGWCQPGTNWPSALGIETCGVIFLSLGRISRRNSSGSDAAPGPFLSHSESSRLRAAIAAARLSLTWEPWCGWLVL